MERSESIEYGKYVSVCVVLILSVVWYRRHLAQEARDKAEYEWTIKQRLDDIHEARRQLRLREEAWKIDWSEIELIKRLAGGAFGDVGFNSPLFFSRSNSILKNNRCLRENFITNGLLR